MIFVDQITYVKLYQQQIESLEWLENTMGVQIRKGFTIIREYIVWPGCRYNNIDPVDRR